MQNLEERRRLTPVFGSGAMVIRLSIVLQVKQEYTSERRMYLCDC